jgi:hypothetical protein
VKAWEDEEERSDQCIEEEKDVKITGRWDNGDGNEDKLNHRDNW